MRQILSWDEQDPYNVGWYYAVEDDAGHVVEQSMDVTWRERSGIDIDAYGPDDEEALRQAIARYRERVHVRKSDAEVARAIVEGCYPDQMVSDPIDNGDFFTVNTSGGQELVTAGSIARWRETHNDD